MKLFFILIFCLISFSTNAFDLQSGDVVLISFNCYECRVIESETNSSFSHSGVILLNEKKQVFVAQALGSVRLSSLQEFLKNKTPGTKASIYRPFEFEQHKDFLNLEKNMHEIFTSEFLGLPFDARFSWDNFDKEGREMLYCSEFVAKFLDHFLSVSSEVFPLTYEKNHDFWFRYFQGKIPEGEIGNSPASLSKDRRFHLIGILD